MFMSYTEKLKRPDLKPAPKAGGTQWLTCDLCDKQDVFWNDELDLEMHRKDNHTKLAFSMMAKYPKRFCSICMRLQESRNELVSHVKTLHLYSSPSASRVEREIFICDYCNRIFFNKKVLEMHIMSLHLWNTHIKSTKKLACPKCNRFCKMICIWYHLQHHNIPSISMCDICLEKCDNSKMLLDHLKNHPLYLKCEICNFYTAKENIFQAHLEKHKSKETIDVSAEHRCNTVLQTSKAKKYFHAPFNSRSAPRYNIHNSIKGVLLPNFIYICVFCREICTSKQEMAEHVMHGHEIAAEPAERPQHKCRCGAAFGSKVLFRHHVFKMKGDHGEPSAEPEHVKAESEQTAQGSPAQIQIEMAPTPEPAEQQAEAVEQNDDDIQVVYMYAEDCEDAEMVPADEKCIVGF